MNTKKGKKIMIKYRKTPFSKREIERYKTQILAYGEDIKRTELCKVFPFISRKTWANYDCEAVPGVNEYNFGKRKKGCRGEVFYDTQKICKFIEEKFRRNRIRVNWEERKAERKNKKKFY